MPTLFFFLQNISPLSWSGRSREFQKTILENYLPCSSGRLPFRNISHWMLPCPAFPFSSPRRLLLFFAIWRSFLIAVFLCLLLQTCISSFCSSLFSIALILLGIISCKFLTISISVSLDLLMLHSQYLLQSASTKFNKALPSKYKVHSSFLMANGWLRVKHSRWSNIFSSLQCFYPGKSCELRSICSGMPAGLSIHVFCLIHQHM